MAWTRPPPLSGDDRDGGDGGDDGDDYGIQDTGYKVPVVLVDVVDHGRVERGEGLVGGHTRVNT